MPEHWSEGSNGDKGTLTFWMMVTGTGAWNAPAGTPTWNPANAAKEREEGEMVGRCWTDLAHGSCRTTPQACRRKCAIVIAFIIVKMSEFNNKSVSWKCVRRVWDPQI